MKLHRREMIRKLIEENGKVSFDELKALFPDLSEMTFRRDLIALEGEGIAVRTIGGAVTSGGLIKSDNDLFIRTTISQQEKRQIATKASKLVKEGLSFYIDGGSTTYYFAKEIPDIDCYVVTNGITVALEVSKKNNPLVTMIGGELRKNNLATRGSMSHNDLNLVNFEVCILTTTALGSDGNFTCGTQSEADLKKNVISKSKTKVMLLDDSKLGRTMPYTFGSLKDIDIIVTNDNFPPDVKDKFIKMGIEIL